MREILLVGGKGLAFALDEQAREDPPVLLGRELDGVNLKTKIK